MPHIMVSKIYDDSGLSHWANDLKTNNLKTNDFKGNDLKTNFKII